VYRVFDIMADTSTNLAVMELVLKTSDPGDLYQDNSAPDNPNEAYSTYVTIGDPRGSNAPGTLVLGAPVNIDPESNLVFDDQNLSIAWAPAKDEATKSGRFQIARIVLKDDASASWTLMGWQTGLPARDFKATGRRFRTLMVRHQVVTATALIIFSLTGGLNG